MALKTFFLNSDNANYGEEEFNYIQKFLLQQGILNTQGADYNDFIDLKATQNGGGNMSVNVGLGTAVINTIRNSVSFKVFVSNLASANLAVGANSSGSNRVDAVILKISRAVEPDALMSNVASLQVVAGSGVSALTDNAIQTAIGADYDFIRLANITVANGASQILTANIADTRVRCYSTDATVPNPTIIKFRQLASDPSTPAEGEMWYNTTANILRYFDGSSVINIQASTYTGGNGIDVTTGVVSVKLATGGGLEFNGSGQLKTISKFGGDGSDGALTITSGTTTVDLGGAQFFIKQYSSISITGTGKLAFTNPHANGTHIILKSKGDVVLTSSTVPNIDASGMGANASTGAQASIGAAYGNGPDGQGNSNGYTTPGGTKLTYSDFIFASAGMINGRAVYISPGAGGGTGVTTGGNYRATGGGGGASYLFNGGTSPQGSNGTAGTGVGAGGGGSSSYNNGYPGSYMNAPGGRGGGAVLIECAGALNFAGAIWSKGLAGANGSSYSSGTGSGGGGAGGTITILYNTLTANTGTFDNSGGAGGSNSYTGGAGGASMGGVVAKNTVF